MKYRQIKKRCGYIFLSVSFFLFEIYDVLLKEQGNTLFCSVIFLLFLTGILLKSEKKHQWVICLKHATLLTTVTVLSDFILKWIMINTISFAAMKDAWDLLFRDIPCFVLIWISVLLYQKEEEPAALSKALLMTVGDSMTILLISHLIVSDLPSYWNNSHHLLFWHVFYDFLIAIIIVVMLAADENGSRKLFGEYRDGEVFRKLSAVLFQIDKKTKKAQAVLYFIVFGYLYFYYFLNTTTFPAYFDMKRPGLTAMLVKGSLVMLLLGRLLAVFALFDADQKREKIWLRITLIFGIIFYGQSQFGALFNFMMLLCAGIKKDARTVLKEAFGIGLGLMLVSWWCASKKIISDVVVDGNHGLGIIYATDCYAHWFYLFAMYCLIRRGKFRWFEYLITLLISLYMYHMTGGDTNLICFGLLWLIMLIRQYLLQHIKMHKFRASGIFIYAYWIFAALYFIAVRNFKNLSAFLEVKYHSLWQRLNYGRIGLHNYKIRFLFQSIEEHGNGNLDYTRHAAFYLDDSYIRILLMYGVLMFLFIMILMTWFMARSKREKQNLLYVILFIVALQSLLEQRLPEFWYNIFLILPLMNLNSLSNERIGKEHSN